MSQLPTNGYERKGPSAWMAGHSVTANLVMLVFLVGGLISGYRIKKEVFPDFELDQVQITVPYPGASPQEVERGIILAIEEAVQGLEGVNEVRASAREGVGTVTVEMIEGENLQRLAQDIKSEVDRITSFPEEAEEPQVTIVSRKRFVVSLALYGDQGETVLREYAEHVRDRLLQDPDITQVELVGVRNYEIGIEIPQKTLRTYNLTLDEVAKRIGRTSLELPGGAVKAPGGDILVRVKERKDYGHEFGKIPIITANDGTQVLLEDIADIKDGFEETDHAATYNGKPAVIIEVYRVGDQTPVSVSNATKRVVAAVNRELPPGLSIVLRYDRSEIYKQRMQLLIKNGFMGLGLVFILLALFLEARLAFWVALGIPISFLGSLLFLPAADVSINMVSMFAFIVTLGIVVDDAIVVGENVYHHHQRGIPWLKASIFGTREIAMPVTFSVLTNMVTFLVDLVNRRYRPFLDLVLRWRYVTVSIGIAILLIMIGYVKSGRLGFELFPKVESDYAKVTAMLPFGTAFQKTEKIQQMLVGAAQEVVAENGGKALMEGIFARINDNQTDVRIYLTPPDKRPISTAKLTELWRKRVGVIPGLESILFESDAGGPGRGAAITVELSHKDIHLLEQAAKDVADALAFFPNVKDIDDGFAPGKQQVDFQIKPEARSLGLRSQEVARQVRHSYYGAEALRQQRGRNEVKIMVRLPKKERVSEYNLEEMILRTPAGNEIPLRSAVTINRGRAYTDINRRDSRRVVTVEADVQPRSKAGQILASLKSETLAALQKKYPGLTYSFEGRQADQRESMQSLLKGLLVALIVIYAMLAVPLNSYIQPLIIMAAIPFGIVGAVIGHMIMGYSLSVLSMFGVVALSGVVVNDSLVLIDLANRREQAGMSRRDAVHQAGIQRFRPIILTTLTTFGGLSPMIFETS
ncbi:MAG: efflux RND transporter permease subunit, partial [Desulfobacterales bacterium]